VEGEGKFTQVENLTLNKFLERIQLELQYNKCAYK
jgi:hypothetical protein